ncbi:MAG: DUF302 domain-containing protein [Cyanobacteria bacterium P01_G01_bin.39]
MNYWLKLGAIAILIICNACSQQTSIDDNGAMAITVADVTNDNQNGLITVSSPYSVLETSDRLEQIIQDKGLTLFTRIDHQANAATVGQELNPTQLIIFGNPKVGTPLMNCAATTAIDLPQKFLIVQDNNQQTQIIYNSPQYLQQRHDINGCDQFLDQVSAALSGIAKAATKQGS